MAARTNEHGRVRQGIQFHESEYRPALARAEADGSTFQIVVQILLAHYAAGTLRLGPLPDGGLEASTEGLSVGVFLTPEERAAAEDQARRDGVSFGLAVRRLVRGYADDLVDVALRVRDLR